ncbi:hypothetical protein PBRA_005185 [Plasmodiophora brassicae]|nr:hypothetical protein PBRA_005185 [Plasmodiophora brassicae]
MISDCKCRFLKTLVFQFPGDMPATHVFVGALVALLATDACALSLLRPSDSDMIVSLHNSYRAKVQPAASNMRGLKWSPVLAASAQDVADKCPTKHSVTVYGENIVYGSPFLDIRAWHDKWGSEAANFDYQGGGRCRSGDCGHYVQMVWAAAGEFGCGVKQCPNITIGAIKSSTAQIVVCHYSSKVYSNALPYTAGPSCSACPVGSTCAPGSSLCVTN